VKVVKKSWNYDMSFFTNYTLDNPELINGCVASDFELIKSDGSNEIDKPLKDMVKKNY
jgi:hypothetical protein